MSCKLGIDATSLYFGHGCCPRATQQKSLLKGLRSCKPGFFYPRASPAGKILVHQAGFSASIWPKRAGMIVGKRLVPRDDGPNDQSASDFP